jgi:hypothetical protein
MYYNSNITSHTLQIKTPRPRPEADADHCIAEGAETLIDTPEDGQIGRNM